MVEATINGKTLPLKKWSELYGIEYHTLWYRYNSGMKNEDLLVYTPRNKLTPEIVHSLWGGTWKYAKPKKYWRGNEKWVYMGGTA